MARVVPNLESMRLYRGRGGEVMRGAACRLLEVCALLRMPCATKVTLTLLTLTRTRTLMTLTRTLTSTPMILTLTLTLRHQGRSREAAYGRRVPQAPDRGHQPRCRGRP